MKVQLKIAIVTLLTLSATFLNGCKKGEDGAPGENGKDGSANVTTSTYSVSTWTYSSPKWYRTLSVPELTPDNINSASVQTYIGTGTNTWTALPNTFYNSGGSNYFMGFETTIGSVKVTWIYNNIGSGDDPNTFFGNSSSQFKVVVIPPKQMTLHPDIDLNNYQEVKTTFNLKD